MLYCRLKFGSAILFIGFQDGVNNFAAFAFCSFVYDSKSLVPGIPLGNFLVSAPNPKKSVAVLSDVLKSLKVVIVFIVPPICIVWKFFGRGVIVLMLITPPANSPGRSGVAVFVITRLSNILDGKISKENAFRSDSVLGSGASFNIAKL